MADTSTFSPLSEADARGKFEIYEHEVAVKNARLAAFLAGLFMVAGASLDWFVFPEWGWPFLKIRVAVAGLLMGTYMVLGWNIPTWFARTIAQGIALLPLASICWMISLTGGGNSVYYAGLNLVLLGMSLLLRWSFRNSLAMTACTLGGYGLTVMYTPGAFDFRTFFNNAYFLFVSGVFVTAGSWYYERLRFREFKLRNEVEHSRELLAQQNQQLSELDEAKTRFFANINHELRTPLTVMLGVTDTLRGRDATPAERADLLEMLHDNGLRLLKLIDDLLDIVRFDTGYEVVKRQPTLLESHLAGLLRPLVHLAGQQQVKMHWSCETDSPAIQLDRDKFDKILLNLTINAIKFTPAEGTVTVNVVVRDGRMVAKVKDTGVGIPPESMARVFERFWQVDAADTRKFQGAGIGLSLVRSLSEAMEGRISVSSEVGKGSEFTLELPAEAVPEEACVQVRERITGGKKIEELHRRAAMSLPEREQATDDDVTVLAEEDKPLVLIADDEPDIRRFVRMQLNDVRVIEASDGEEAWKLALQHRPQVAVLDYMMPGIDGVEVCRRITSTRETHGTAVMLVTARNDEEAKMSALHAGACDFLTKPFSSVELALRMANQLTLSKVRMDLTQALEQLKHSESQLVSQEKMSSLGRMSAGLIHEINNPLNYARAGLHALSSLMQRLPDPIQPDVAEILADVREGVDRVCVIISDLRQFTRDDPSLGDANLLEIAESARRMVSHDLSLHRIKLEVSVPGEPPVVHGHAPSLVQVVVNLLQNAIHAIADRREAGEGRIDIKMSHNSAGWLMEVRDNGGGIPEEHLTHIFDPFYTTKEVGAGMGLGLSISHQILKNHHAEVKILCETGEATTFHIQFPNN